MFVILLKKCCHADVRNFQVEGSFCLDQPLKTARYMNDSFVRYRICIKLLNGQDRPQIPLYEVSVSHKWLHWDRYLIWHAFLHAASSLVNNGEIYKQPAFGYRFSQGYVRFFITTILSSVILYQKNIFQHSIKKNPSISIEYFSYIFYHHNAGHHYIISIEYFSIQHKKNNQINNSPCTKKGDLETEG